MTTKRAFNFTYQDNGSIHDDDTGIGAVPTGSVNSTFNGYRNGDPLGIVNGNHTTHINGENNTNRCISTDNTNHLQYRISNSSKLTTETGTRDELVVGSAIMNGVVIGNNTTINLTHSLFQNFDNPVMIMKIIH